MWIGYKGRSQKERQSSVKAVKHRAEIDAGADMRRRQFIARGVPGTQQCAVGPFDVPQRLLARQRSVRRLFRQTENRKAMKIEQFVAEVDAFIRWYNEKRIKLSPGSLSPVEYRQNLCLNS